MIDIPVASVMAATVPTVPPETSTVETARLLRRVDVPGVVVCDRRERPIGIVTESDVVAVVAERGGNRPVESFMSTPVVTTDPSTSAGIAADRMRDAGVRLLCVVDAEADGDDDVDDRADTDADSLRGLVTREDLAPHISRHRLDIEWTGEPLSLDETDPPGRRIPDTPRGGHGPGDGPTTRPPTE